MLGRLDYSSRQRGKWAISDELRTSERGGPLLTAAYALALRAIRPLEGFCLRREISPTAITLASLGLSVFAAALAGSGWLFSAGVLYLAAGGLDLLDGHVARLTGQASPRGAALDSIVDRVAEALVLGGLAWGARGSPAASLAMIFLVASMGVSYARARGEGLGVHIGQGAMARGPRLLLASLLMCAEGLFGGFDQGRPSSAFAIGLGLLALATAMTAAHRVVLVLLALPGAGELTAGPQAAPPGPVHPPPRVDAG
jgi:phosphatidylinositol phosphate synthase